MSVLNLLSTLRQTAISLAALRLRMRGWISGADMVTRDAVARFAPTQELILRSPPNWTAIVFFAALSILHLVIAFSALDHGRWEGYLSLLFACGFGLVACACCFARHELTILSADRRIRLRNRLGPVRFDRFVDFTDIQAIRLTLSSSRSPRESRIELLCEGEDIDCPPTTVPRQEALYLAILMGVRLIKISNDPLPQTQDRPI